MNRSTHESNLRAQVSAWLDSGLTVPEVESRLVESGEAPDYASSIVNAVLAEQLSSTAGKAVRQARALFFGGVVICILGGVMLVAGLLAFVRPDLGLPTHVGIFAGGVSGVILGLTLIVRAIR